MPPRLIDRAIAAAAAKIEALQEPERSLACMQNSNLWPAYPFLMLRHVSFQMGNPDIDAGLGFMLPDPSNEAAFPAVFMANFVYHVVMLKEPINNLPQKSYTSLEAVLADGWRVD